MINRDSWGHSYLIVRGEILEWFKKRGVTLTYGFYCVGANRYLKKEGYTDCRLNSCLYNEEHMFVFLTDFRWVDDQAAWMGTYKRFEENDHARSIKEKLKLENTEFITALTEVVPNDFRQPS